MSTWSEAGSGPWADELPGSTIDAASSHSRDGEPAAADPRNDDAAADRLPDDPDRLEHDDGLVVDDVVRTDLSSNGV
jgi:hypothetical protein